MGGLTRLPGVAFALGNRRILKDHIRRLLVQQHEADRTLYKAMVTDTTLPLDHRLQVGGLLSKGKCMGGGMGALLEHRCQWWLGVQEG